MLGTRGAMLGSIEAMLGSIGAMLGSIGAMLGSIGAMLGSIGAMLGSIAAMLGSIGAMLGSIGPLSGDKPSGRDAGARGLPVRRMCRGGGDSRVLGPDIRVQRTAVRFGTFMTAVDARSSRESRRVADAVAIGCR